MAKLQDVETARYEVRSLLVSSLHYGVPQNRQRVYILAVRSDEVGQAAASKMVDEAVANVHRMTLKAPPVAACFALAPNQLMVVASKFAETWSCLGMPNA